MQNKGTFFITYFAKKHKAFITRKGQYDKPDGTQGQIRNFQRRKSLFDLLGFRRRWLENGNGKHED